MNETLSTLAALLRQVCNVLIVLGCIVAGAFAGMFADGLFGLAGVHAHSGFMYFGELVGAAYGIRRCWLSGSGKKSGAGPAGR